MASSLADRYMASRRHQKTAGILDIGKKLISPFAAKAAPAAAAAAKLPSGGLAALKRTPSAPLLEGASSPTGIIPNLGMPQTRRLAVPSAPISDPVSSAYNNAKFKTDAYRFHTKSPGWTGPQDITTPTPKGRWSPTSQRTTPGPVEGVAAASQSAPGLTTAASSAPAATAVSGGPRPQGVDVGKPAGSSPAAGFDSSMAGMPQPGGSPVSSLQGPLPRPEQLGSISQSAKQLLRPAGLMAAGGAGLIGADAMFGGKPNSMTGVPPLLSSADTNRGVPFINGAPSVNNGGPTTQGRPPLLSAEDTTGVPPLLSAEDTTSGFPSINNGAPATPGMPSPGGPAGPPRLPPVAGDMSPQPPESQSGVPGVPGALGGPDPSKLTRSQYPAAKDPAAATAQDMAAEVTAESGGWTDDVMKWISGMLPEWAAKPLSQLTEAIGPNAMVFGVPLGLLGVYMLMKTMMGKSGASQVTAYKLAPTIAKRTEFGKFLPANGTTKLKT